MIAIYYCCIWLTTVLSNIHASTNYKNALNNSLPLFCDCEINFDPKAELINRNDICYPSMTILQAKSIAPRQLIKPGSAVAATEALILWQNDTVIEDIASYRLVGDDNISSASKNLTIISLIHFTENSTLAIKKDYINIYRLLDENDPTYEMSMNISLSSLENNQIIKFVSNSLNSTTTIRIVLLANTLSSRVLLELGSIDLAERSLILIHCSGKLICKVRPSFTDEQPQLAPEIIHEDKNEKELNDNNRIDLQNTYYSAYNYASPTYYCPIVIIIVVIIAIAVMMSWE